MRRVLGVRQTEKIFLEHGPIRLLTRQNVGNGNTAKCILIAASVRPPVPVRMDCMLIRGRSRLGGEEKTKGKVHVE